MLFLGVITGELVVTDCHEGVEDCDFIESTSGTCAYNNEEYPAPGHQGTIMAMSTIFAMFMAFGIGANDAANSWATSVGSHAISIQKAVILCGVFEWLGATCLGSGVSSTIQKGVSDVDDPDCWACGYCNAQTSVYMAGMMGALIGASIFLLLASLTSIPVSTTHAIVGGVVGMTMTGVGGSCLNWEIDGGLGGIVLSWVISPVLSGVIAVIGFAFSRRFVINAQNPRFRALVLMPVLYFLSTFTIVFVTTLKAKAIKKKLDLNTKLIVSFVIAVCVALFANFVVKPEVKKSFPSESENIQKLCAEETAKAKGVAGGDVELQTTTAVDSGIIDLTDDATKADDSTKASICNTDKIVVTADFADFPLEASKNVDQLDAIWVFRNLLVFNACLESFAHGSNDTANATGAFSAVYQIYTAGDDCQKSDSEVWIMAVAGLFVALGVATLGYRVIRTIGSELTMIDFHKGFYIEFASTIATVVATLQELPVSTTHCQVGAVFAVGLYCKITNTGEVNARLLTLIFAGWVITLPLAGGIAAIVVAISESVLRSS